MNCAARDVREQCGKEALGLVYELHAKWARGFQKDCPLDGDDELKSASKPATEFSTDDDAHQDRDDAVTKSPSTTSTTDSSKHQPTGPPPPHTTQSKVFSASVPSLRRPWLLLTTLLTSLILH